MHKVAHVISDRVPPLTSRIAKLLNSDICSVLFLQGSDVCANKERSLENNTWVKQFAKYEYLPICWWQRIHQTNVYVRNLCSVILPELSFVGIWRLICGPRRIVFHGYIMNFWVLLLLRLVGKKMVLIHWGGTPRTGRFRGRLSRFEFRMLDHVFVLMTPEIRYFSNYLGKRVSVLPYASLFCAEWRFAEADYERAHGQRRLILGNSTWHYEMYGEILDKLVPGEWDCVTCMLNYGREGELDKVEAFLGRYREKFGDRLFEWREVLPYDEYCKVIGGAPIYIAPNETQCGLGAIGTGIRQGKTLLLRGDNLQWIRELGVTAYDIDEIKDWSYEGLRALIPSLEMAQTSFKNYKAAYCERFSADEWARQIQNAL